ncbi:sericin-2-like [Oscarella lobularis]|uniref:sericin-2-like n=1 Tax=Oscarella lobularis TaxID=121494 RepID=UPI003314197D
MQQRPSHTPITTKKADESEISDAGTDGATHHAAKAWSFNECTTTASKMDMRDLREETSNDDADSGLASPSRHSEASASFSDRIAGSATSRRAAVRFFVGLDDSDDSDDDEETTSESDYITADECDDADDAEEEEEDEDGFSVAFRNDCAPRPLVNRSCSWSGGASTNDWNGSTRCEEIQARARRRPNSASEAESARPGPTVVKRVRFQADSLNRVHCIVAWNYAYRAARKGPWESLANDRARFQKRIRDLEPVLSPVLSPSHRRQHRQHPVNKVL